jgi:hypothetical protein
MNRFINCPPTFTRGRPFVGHLEHLCCADIWLAVHVPTRRACVFAAEHTNSPITWSPEAKADLERFKHHPDNADYAPTARFADHFVVPIATTIPVFSDASGKDTRGRPPPDLQVFSPAAAMPDDEPSTLTPLFEKSAILTHDSRLPDQNHWVSHINTYFSQYAANLPSRHTQPDSTTSSISSKFTYYGWHPRNAWPSPKSLHLSSTITSLGCTKLCTDSTLSGLTPRLSRIMWCRAIRRPDPTIEPGTTFTDIAVADVWQAIKRPSKPTKRRFAVSFDQLRDVCHSCTVGPPLGFSPTTLTVGLNVAARRA